MHHRIALHVQHVHAQCVQALFTHDRQAAQHPAAQLARQVRTLCIAACLQVQRHTRVVDSKAQSSIDQGRCIFLRNTDSGTNLGTTNVNDAEALVNNRLQTFAVLTSHIASQCANFNDVSSNLALQQTWRDDNWRHCADTTSSGGRGNGAHVLQQQVLRYAGHSPGAAQLFLSCSFILFVTVGKIIKNLCQAGVVFNNGVVDRSD